MALDDKSEERLVWAFAGLTVLAILAWVFGFLIWDSGQLAGMLAHGRFPSSTPGDVPGVLIRIFSHPGDPAQAWPEVARKDVGPAGLLYVFLALQLAVVVAAILLVIRGIFRFRRRRKSRRLRLGFASPGEIDRLLSASAVQKKAPSVRPSMPKAKASEVGFAIGKDSRSNKQLYGSVEDVFLIVAPPRQGKDVHFCIPYTIDAPGPVLMTSTRADAFGATVSMREKVGQVWVFDPNNMTSWPSRLRWSPVRGCEEPLRALSRASAFVAGAGVGEGVTNASYWTGVATSILRCYLHAAALANRTMADVVRWSTQPTNPEPINILRWGESQGLAAPGWAGELEQASASDSESRGNMWNGVRRALDCFADPSVLASCSPGPDESFDVQAFLAGRNTLYVLGKEKKAGSVAPLVTAMMEDIFDQARAIATRMPNSRLDPPLTVELNEAAHIAPMPNLPGYMGDSGGFSIALHVYLQSLAQARSRWSDDEAAVMWDTAAIRVVMGGSGHVNDLDDISRLIGEVEEKQRTKTRGYDGRSTSVSQQARRVLTVDELRTLEFGNAVVVARSARPVETKLTPWWKRPDAAQIKAGQQRISAMLAEPDRPTAFLPAALPKPALPPGGVPPQPVLPGYQPEIGGRRGLPSRGPGPGQLPQLGAAPVVQPAAEPVGQPVAQPSPQPTADEPQLSVFEQVTTRLPYDGSNRRPTGYPEPSESPNLAPGWGLPVEGRAPWNAGQARAQEEAAAERAPHAADATVETQHPMAPVEPESRRPFVAEATVETTRPYPPQPEQSSAEPFTALPRTAAAAQTPDRTPLDRTPADHTAADRTPADDTQVDAWVPYQVNRPPHRVEPEPNVQSSEAEDADDAWRRYLAEQQAAELEPQPAGSDGTADDGADNSDEAWQRYLAEQQARAAQPPDDPWGGASAETPDHAQAEQETPADSWRSTAPGRVVAQPEPSAQPSNPGSWRTPPPSQSVAGAPPAESQPADEPRSEAAQPGPISPAPVSGTSPNGWNVPAEPAPDSWSASAEPAAAPDSWHPQAESQPESEPEPAEPEPASQPPASGSSPDEWHPQGEPEPAAEAWTQPEPASKSPVSGASLNAWRTPAEPTADPWGTASQPDQSSQAPISEVSPDPQVAQAPAADSWTVNAPGRVVGQPGTSNQPSASVPSPDSWQAPVEQPEPAVDSWSGAAQPDPQVEQPSPADSWRATAPGRVVAQPAAGPTPVEQPQAPDARGDEADPGEASPPPASGSSQDERPAADSWRAPAPGRVVAQPDTSGESVEQQPASQWRAAAAPQPPVAQPHQSAPQSAPAATPYPPAPQSAPPAPPYQAVPQAQPYRVEAQPEPDAWQPQQSAPQPYRVDPQPYRVEPPAAVQPRSAQPYRVDPQPHQQGASQPTEEVAQPYWPGQQSETPQPPSAQQETRPYWVGQPRTQPYRVEQPNAQVDPTSQPNPVRQPPPVDPYVQPPPPGERRSAAPYLADQRVVPAPQYPASQQEQVAPLHPTNPPAQEPEQ